MNDTDLAMSEAELQEIIVDAATTFGWLCYHTFDSRRSVAGFPDLVLVKGRRVIFIELKRQKEKPTPAQQEWLDRLDLVDTVLSGCVRPSDLDRILHVIRTR